jgi:hypothetical protein
MSISLMIFQAGENDDGIEIEDIAIKGRDNQQQQRQSKDAGDHEDDARVDDEVKDKEGDHILLMQLFISATDQITRLF